MVDLISGLTILVGFDAQRKIQQVIELLSILGDRPVSSRGFVDLGVLAVMVGWKLSARGPTCMRVQVLGVILNTWVSEGDHSWDKSWRYIDRSLQVFIIGNMQLSPA